MSNLEQLEIKVMDAEENRRFFYNRKMIGQKVFSMSYGGWFGKVIDFGYNIDDFIVERPSGKSFIVSIFDLRSPEDMPGYIADVKSEEISLTE